MAVRDYPSWVSAICLLLGIWLTPAVLLVALELSQSSNSATPEPRKAASSHNHGPGCDSITNGWAISIVMGLAKAVAGAVGATANLGQLSEHFGVAHPGTELAFGKKQASFGRSRLSDFH